MLKKILKALSVGGAVILDMATPVNLLFVVLLFAAGFALFNEQIILVGFISTLALLTAAVGAGVFAAIMLSTNKKLSPGGFRIFLAFAFLIPLAIWTLEIFNTIADGRGLYVVELAVIMLVFSLVLVPRLRRLYQAKSIMEQA